jgi:peptidoglycan hydrolase FlgJ
VHLIAEIRGVNISDIVLDVARAADPVKSQAAAEKLSHGSSTNQATMSGFDHALTSANAMLQASRDSYIGDGRGSPEILPRVDARTKAYKGLEQLVLKNLVENMLPKDSGVVFGNGTAGDIWRSFLADQLAAEVGKTVDLGVIKKPITASNSAAGQLSTHNSARWITTGGVPYSASV